MIERKYFPATGVDDVADEVFTLDGLGRTTAVSSGSVVTGQNFDSLSRLRAETTASRTVTYGYGLDGSLTSLGAADGVPANTVYSAVTDSRGEIWVATVSGTLAHGAQPPFAVEAIPGVPPRTPLAAVN